MRRYILIGIAALFYYSGLVSIARWWTRRSSQNLIILNYHRASGGNLRHHLIYLQKHYRILHVDTALEELYSFHKKGIQNGRQYTALALTFDDGWRDNYTHAYPLACELQIPFTIYLVPGYIESGDPFWWVEGKRLVSCAQTNEAIIEGRSYNLRNVDERETLVTAIDTRMRYARSVAEREAFLASARAMLSVPKAAMEEEVSLLPLSWEQVREMDESGWVSFGAHTMHHPILAYITDAAEMRREIEGCRVVLEHQLGHPIHSFAYPIGQLQYIGEDVRKTVRQARYNWALTTRYGFNTPGSDPYMVRRIEVDVNQHWFVVAAEAAGLWGGLSRLRWHPFVRKYFTNSK